MKLIADTHTHSTACNHAYSTISENAAAAERQGLHFLGVTEHAPALVGAPPPIYFENLKALPEQVGSVWLLRGVELNILDYSGVVDLPESIIQKLDWVIASMHTLVLEPAAPSEHTKGWLAIAENPHIDVIGHCGDPRFSFDLEAVIPAFQRHGKIVEINTHSFGGRPGSKPVCRQVAQLCMEHGVPVVINSDAHFHNRVGDFAEAVEMLEEMHFPKELVLNADTQRLAEVIHGKSGRRFHQDHVVV